MGSDEIRKIVEIVANSITNTKQLVWGDGTRLEERDASGALTSNLLNQGEIFGATQYFYVRDRLGSITDLTNSSASIISSFSFDSFGRMSILKGTQLATKLFAGYYFHTRSQLSQTRTRSYSSIFGRFINRDLILEGGGINLYSYCRNSPVALVDPSGLAGYSAGVSSRATKRVNRLVPWILPKPINLRSKRTKWLRMLLE